MTIDEIKTASIRIWMSLNGYGDGQKKGIKYWYCSPFRNDGTPSFRLDPTLNLWYDFGLQIGGNIINLVQRINPSWSNHQVLSFLEGQIKKHDIPYTKDTQARMQEEEERGKKLCQSNQESNKSTVIHQIVPLSHPYLRDYILQRRIDYDIAQYYCKEAYYSHEGKEYYAIAFPNIDGGMETRNKYFKRCIGHKTISIIHPYESEQPHCCIFEGFFDMLTYLTIDKWMDIGISLRLPTDLFVLNSTSCVQTLLPYIRRYSSIHCYLDNDEAGKKATSIIQNAYPDIAIDESIRYRGYNDLNDVITGNPITTPIP